MKEREVVSAALALSAASRAMIIKTLTDSLLDLPSEDVDLADVESAWFHEAEDRVLAFERGEIEAVDGEKLIHDLRARAR